MAARIAIDWEAVELLYRAGIRSLKDIGREFGVSDAGILKRAGKYKWERDLSARIKAKFDAKVSAMAVSAEVSAEKRSNENIVVEAYATLQAQKVGEHRAIIPRAIKLAVALLGELELQTKDPVLFEELSELLHAPDEKGVDKLNAIYQKVISTPGRATALKQLAETLKILIGLERMAYGLSDNANGEADKPPAPPVSNEEAARRVAFMLLAATKGKAK